MKRDAARAVDRIVVLGATLCLVGNAYGVPSADFWSAIRLGHPYLPIILLVIVGVFGALSPFESWSNRSLADRNVIMKRRILSSFGRLLDISKAIQPALPTGDLALHVWRRQRTLRHPLSGALKRIATYRMGTMPLNRSFTPGKGIGVSGLCWQKNRELGKDVTVLRAELTDEDTYDAYVRDHGPAAVMNLKWLEFENVKHRGAVFAAPIRNGHNRFVGCVSVDASWGYTELNTHEMWEEIGNLALAIGREEFECT
jgi:hypothetical protein